jgi:hypothetical protein
VGEPLAERELLGERRPEEEGLEGVAGEEEDDTVAGPTDDDALAPREDDSKKEDVADDEGEEGPAEENAAPVEDEDPWAMGAGAHVTLLREVQYEFSCAAVALLRAESAEDAMKESMEMLSW